MNHLKLSRVGFKGAMGGAILSTLMRNNSRLKTLWCSWISLGREGARALQPALCANCTVTELILKKCSLGDEGLCVIVDALGENATVQRIHLEWNGFTHNGLPHVTRLLRLQRDSLYILNLNGNPGILDNEENTTSTL